MKRNRKPELLAPAANVGVALTALRCGADAVYVGGGRHTLRAQSPGVAPRELLDIVGAARAMSKRVYVALNTMPSDDQLRDIAEYLRAVASLPKVPDAVIVSDPGVLCACRDLLPSVPLHLSTQTGACSVASLRFWHQQGVVRAVLPRELTLEDVARISREAPCEVEVFAHGAMCVSVSGRCLLGAYLQGRHANRGDCPQPCRLRYRVLPLDERGGEGAEGFDAEETADGTYLMNARDLNTLPILPALVATGVVALKIEGRTKGEHYAATATRVYRRALDRAWDDPDGYRVDEAWLEQLEALEHRSYSTGFYGGEYRLQALHAVKSGGALRLVGVVREVLSDGSAVIEVKNSFEPGEALSVLPAAPARAPFSVRFASITDLEGRPFERATANRVVKGCPGGGVRSGDMLRR